MFNPNYDQTSTKPNVYLPNTVCSTISICLTCLHCKNLRNCSPEINSYIMYAKRHTKQFLMPNKCLSNGI